MREILAPILVATKQARTDSPFVFSLVTSLLFFRSLRHLLVLLNGL